MGLEGVGFAFDGVEDGAADDAQVEGEGPVFDVPYVVLYAFFHFPKFVG